MERSATSPEGVDRHRRAVAGYDLQAGADDYLVKPFNKEELHARLKAGLRVLLLQSALSERVDELEKALEENRTLRLRVPL